MAERFIRKATKAGPAGGGEAPAEMGWVEGGCEAVGEFLSLLKWEDGSSREPGSITVFVDRTVVKACLLDKDADRVGFVSADTWGGLWEAVERCLRTNGIEWRQNKQRRRG